MLAMRSSHPLIAAMCALVAAAAIATTGASYTIPIPAGTSISAHVADSISSSSASEGQSFGIVVTDAVLVQGWVVVQKGAAGQGHVVAVNPPGKGGHEASISVQVDWVTANGGQHLALTALKGKTTPLVFGVEGSYAASFQKGKDVTVGTDIVFPAYTSADRVLTVNAGP